MKTLNSTNEFVVGCHDIGWVDSDFKERFGDIDFGPRTLGTFKTLDKVMTGDQMIKEGIAKECELGDVLAFLQNPPEGTKDGWANIFIVGGFVVHVGWGSFVGGWDVSAWDRDDGWDAGSRVFSPAISRTLESFEPEFGIPLDSLDIRDIDQAIKATEENIEVGKSLLKKLKAFKKAKGKKKKK